MTGKGGRYDWIPLKNKGLSFNPPDKIIEGSFIQEAGMARKRISMKKIKELFRLKLQGLGNRKIARSLNVSHSRVGDILKLVAEKGLKIEDAANMDEGDLEQKLRVPPKLNLTQNPLPDFAKIHEELKRKGVTLQLLWEEYRLQHPNGYGRSWFCEQYRHWSKTLQVSMRQNHKAGEKVFVDFVGLLVPIINRNTGEIKEHPLFVGVLGASNYTYAELCRGQDIASWIKAHVNMFNYFGGVSEIIVPDNLKSGVKKPCYYEPDLNQTYLDFSRHYDCAVIPARVRKSKDKAKVEVGVLIVERWILAALRNRKFFSIAEANEAIHELLEKLNTKPFKKMEGSRRSLFEKIEKAVLKPLPERSYEFALWKKCTVNIDYHIEVDLHYYSVPFSLIHQAVEARITSNTIEIYFKGKRVSSHARSYIQGGHATIKEHMPKNHQFYTEWTPQRVVDWGKQIGPNTSEIMQKIMETRAHPEQGYRSCLGIIRLGKKFGNDRVEKASLRTLAGKIYSYQNMKSILEKNLDMQPIPAPTPDTHPKINHEFVRGNDFYNN